jgi:hypothetical protein
MAELTNLSFYRSLVLILILYQNPHQLSIPFMAAPVWDIIVAVGLLRGKDVWKQWALIRAVLGAAVFGIIIPLVQQTIPGFIEGVFQIVYSVGIFLLLYGGVPSRERVMGGVGTVIFAWLGVVGSVVAAVLLTDMNKPGDPAAINAQRELERQAIPAGKFSDDEIGVTVNFPSGWSLLPADNSILPARDAKMIAVNMRTGCWALLLVENIPSGVGSLDQYLDFVLMSRQFQIPGIKDMGRTDVMMGNRSARRMMTAWEESGRRLTGYNSVCRVGSDYYLLSGWSVEEAGAQAFESFQSLEKSFEITGPSAIGETEGKPPARKRR